MASTYSPNLGLELMATGEDSGTWGTKTNTNLSPLLETSIVGVSSVVYASDADKTLTITNGTDSAGRYFTLVCTGTISATRKLICPLVNKTYLVVNTTTGGQSLNVIGASGTGTIVPNGTSAFIYCDGTNYNQAITGFNNLQLVTPVLGAATGTSVVLGGATGGSQGSGTINATGFYVNGVGISNNVVYTKTAFTATAGQTTFTLAYSVGYIDIWYNGSKLSTSEYTASNGTSIVLGTACAAGDIVETVAWTTFTTTNTNIGAGTGTSLALGGATVGSNSLAVTGSSLFPGSTTITAAGLVGIGTASPAAPLNISGSGALIRLDGPSTTASAHIGFTHAGSGVCAVGLDIAGGTIVVSSPANSFCVRNDMSAILFSTGGSGNEVARFGSDGSFLVGSTTNAGAGGISCGNLYANQILLGNNARLQQGNFVNVGGNNDITVSVGQAGKLSFIAYQNGIGTQFAEYDFLYTQAGTLYLSPAIYTVGASVISSVTVPGGFIRLACTAANTNIYFTINLLTL